MSMWGLMPREKELKIRAEPANPNAAEKEVIKGLKRSFCF